MNRSEPIVLVSHEADDHSWQFVGASGFSMADALLVSLESIVKVDPTVLEIADLPPGWQALRDAIGKAWNRREHPPIPEEER